MKKMRLFIMATFIVFAFACHDSFQNIPGCDDTTVNFTIQLKFFPQTSYRCTPSTLQPPPFADGFNNYLATSSATDVANIGAGFLCKVIVTSACTRSLTTYKQVVYWNSSGPNLTVRGLYTEDTNIIVEYYDICMTCNSFSARPYFVGTLVVPKGQRGGEVQMSNQAEKPC